MGRGVVRWARECMGVVERGRFKRGNGGWDIGG